MSNDSSSTGGLIGLIIYLGVIALLIASMWKVFQKAGQPGWAAIVPIYNVIVMLKIAGKPAWWILLYLIPFVNFIIALVVAVSMAKAFGKSALFGVFGLGFFSFIGYPMLAFGDAQYQGAPKQ
jgi:hypothetical protein